ncbi:MAG: hypothetical protein ACOX1V_01985 [Candidatus Iainarchaeum sp.]
MKEEITQLNPESIKSERERLNAIIYTQLIICGQLIANPSANLITQNVGIRSSLEYIDSLLVSYSNEEYNKKVKILKEKLDAEFENKHAILENNRWIPLIRENPQKYFIHLMEWLRLMNELLQKSGFIEAGREIYQFKEKKMNQEIETAE